MTSRRTLIIALAAMPPGLALAHVTPGARGPNGGEMQDIGPYHAELLARDGALSLFLFDSNDRPLPAARASGQAIILADGRQQTLPLVPRADGAALVASGDFRATPALRVVVQLVPAPGQPRAQARFTPVPP